MGSRLHLLLGHYITMYTTSGYYTNMFFLRTGVFHVYLHTHLVKDAHYHIITAINHLPSNMYRLITSEAVLPAMEYDTGHVKFWGDFGEVQGCKKLPL